MGAKQSASRSRLVPAPARAPATIPAPAPAPHHNAHPNVQFRVLVIGRANAGKTSILRNVCNTTDSPKIYRSGPLGTRHQIKLDQLNPTTDRGYHNIEDELIFPNHQGYVFHDSRGFEAGGEDELKIIQGFVTRKSRERRLKDRLHAIWYCIPMDNNRPELDMQYFADICPDKNVPVIAVFTKFDQFQREIQMKLKDKADEAEHRKTSRTISKADIDKEVERVFNRFYLGNLRGSPPFVRLERMHEPTRRCNDLIDVTTNALGGGVVVLMLVAVQRDNLELSVKQAIKW